MTTSIAVPVSIGELWDKYTILLIKQEKITDKEKLNFVNTEIKHLDALMSNYTYQENELFILLKNVNKQLWDIEDHLRIKEKNKEFDNDFIDLARSVYYTNDERADVKKKINVLFNSAIHETKEYVEYKK
jgi:predicted oxidoreductase (fatty acid repression mutant protein)